MSRLTFACVLCCAAASAAAEPTPFDRATRAALAAESVPELTAALEALEALPAADPKDGALVKKLIAATRLERGTLLHESLLLRLSGENAVQQQALISSLARQALADFEAATRQDPRLVGAWIGYAKIHTLPGGDRTRAQAALAEALKLDPAASEAWRLRGTIRSQTGQFAEALSDLDEARKLDPKQAATHEARGVALAGLGKADEAEQALDQAIELAPRAAAPRLARARLNIARQNSERALADLNGLLALDPAHLQALMLRAGLWERAGKTDPLLADLEAILERQPQAMDVHRMRAAVLKRTGKLDGALAAAQRRVSTNPGLATRLELGTLYTIANEHAKAVEQFTAAVAADANSLAALVGRADALLAAKRIEQAAADYGRVIEKNPRDTHVLNNLAWLLATTPEEKIRDGRRAVDLATEACRLTDNKHPAFLSTLAAAYAERGNLERAVETAERAIALVQGDAKEQYAKELASYKAGKPWRVEVK